MGHAILERVLLFGTRSADYKEIGGSSFVLFVDDFRCWSGMRMFLDIIEPYFLFFLRSSSYLHSLV